MITRKTRPKWAPTAALVAVGIAAAHLPARAETARELLDRAKRLDDTTRHWTDRTQRMQLNIVAAGGENRERELAVYTKRYAGDEEKSISFFLAPAEVRGTAFLQWSHKGRDDEQWLYLPEFRRTRQIAARLRDESFVGTDFTYRDLEIVGDLFLWSEAEARTRLLGDETVDGAPCHSIELRPQREESAYQRLVLALDRDKLTPRRLDFYDTGDVKVKSLGLADVREIGAVPTAHRLEMSNLKKGSRTVVTLPEVKYGTGLGDDLFTQRQLEKGAP